MAISVFTNSSAGLLSGIKKGIDEKQIVTWSYDEDGDFTHTPDQWKRKAWLRPKTETGELRFIILTPETTTLTKAVSGVYHGRFIEMLVTHFETSFSSITATIP